VLRTIDLFLGECCLVARNARYAAGAPYLAYVRRATACRCRTSSRSSACSSATGWSTGGGG
jgi:hypothetical protein